MPESRSRAAPSQALLRTLVLAWMLLFGLIGTGLVGPNLSSIEREFGFGHAHFGLGFALVQIACSLAVLYAAARQRVVDSGRAFVAGLLAQAAGFLLVFLAHTALLLAAGWALITLGTVMGAVANGICARLWRDDPRRGVALLHGFNGIGKVAGPLLAAGCLVLGWRISFLAVGGITLALLAAFWARREALSALSASEKAPDSTDYRQILRRPFYWLCILPFGLIAGGDVCFAALLPSYYERSHGLSPEAASLLLVAHLLGLAVGRFVFVGLAERLGNNRIVGICLAAGLCVFPALWGSTLAVWAAAVFGIGWMFSSTWPTYYAQIAPHFRDRPHLLDYGSGLGNAIGIALCVSISGILAARFPPAALLAGPAPLWLFGAIYFSTPLSRKSDG